MGFIYIVGLVFLVGVNAGFMDVGSTMGFTKFWEINIRCFNWFIGISDNFSRHGLCKHQIEDANGYVKAVMVSLSIGVGFALPYPC